MRTSGDARQPDPEGDRRDRGRESAPALRRPPHRRDRAVVSWVSVPVQPRWSRRCPSHPPRGYRATVATRSPDWVRPSWKRARLSDRIRGRVGRPDNTGPPMGESASSPSRSSPASRRRDEWPRCGSGHRRTRRWPSQAPRTGSRKAVATRDQPGSGVRRWFLVSPPRTGRRSRRRGRAPSNRRLDEALASAVLLVRSVRLSWAPQRMGATRGSRTRRWAFSRTERARLYNERPL